MIWARLRIVTGLVLALFVVGHLSNHTLGLVSMEAMEGVRRLLALIWQNPLGTVALYGALVVHLCVALRTLYIRRSLKLTRWELAQLLLGLLVPLLIFTHVIGTRLNQAINGFDVDYPMVIAAIWSNDWTRVKQVLLVGAVWLHLCVGVHYWWRNKSWYRRYLPVFYGLAVLLPVVSVLGFIRASVDQANAFAVDPGLIGEVFARWNAAADEKRALLLRLDQYAPWAYGALVALVLLARWLFRVGERRAPRIRIEHPLRPVAARVGQTVLEALRIANVPHASTCGGRARCTTCRIRVGKGGASLPAPAGLELEALARIDAPQGVRLACQLRPERDLAITPLVAAGERAERYTPGGVYGQERQVAAMFVDLRGSTGLNEARLPYDVVFILNQFFAEMSSALQETDGHYAQFAGDGLMALYGLRCDLSTACRQALLGARQMERRLRDLNLRLEDELPAPLRIGIGIHCGEAIVGTMGPPSSPNLSAIGDNINIAARLESMTKTFGVSLVVSESTLQASGVDGAVWPLHDAPVRGREEPVKVRAVGTCEALMRDTAEFV